MEYWKIEFLKRILSELILPITFAFDTKHSKIDGFVKDG